MTSTTYVPLHVHTEHSELDGLARLDGLTKAVSDAGMSACAITDHGSLAGLWSFARSAQRYNIKPIPGIEAYLAIGSRHEPKTMQTYNDEGMGDATDLVVGRLKNKSYYHLTVLARNRTGWHNLIRIHNESQKTKRGKHPLIDYDLLKQYGEGLIVLTGCLASPVAGSAAQTGVVAQLVLDELNLFDTLPDDVSEDYIADIEDLIFDAIASADTGVAKDVIADLEEVIQDISPETLVADYADAAYRLSRLRSNFPQLLGYDAIVSIQNAVEPLIIKHDTIDAKGVKYAGLTGTHFTTDSVEAIISAYDDAAEVAKQHRVKGQRLTEQNVKDTLREVLFGIIEQHYARLFDRGLMPALADIITSRVEESSQLLNDAYTATQRLIDCVGKDYVFVEIMDHGITSETYAMDHLIPLAEHFDLDLVVTNDSHYIHEDDAEAHDAFLAVGTRSSLDTPGRFSFNGGNYHLMSEAEIRAIHPDDEHWQQAVTNTAKVAELVAEDTVPKPEVRLPKFSLPEGFGDADDYLRHLVEEMAPGRYGDDWREDEEIVERMNHELSVISDMGFSDYFLITWDIMDFCAREGITTGAGRGCLTAETLVWTEQGYKPLPDIAKGDVVRTHTGLHVPVTQTFVYDVNETLLNIRSWFDGRGNTMTKDHKVLIRKAAVETDKKRLNSGARWGEGFDSEPIWVQAQDVEVGDFVCIPRPASPGTAPSVFDLANFLPEVAPDGVEFTVTDDEIIESFGVNRPYDHSMRDVSKATGVSRNGLRSLINTERSAMTIGGNNAVLVKENSRTRANRAKLAQHLESAGFSSIAQWIEHIDQHCTVTTSVKRYITVDHDFLFLLGAWASNGWIRQDSPKAVGFAERRSTADSTIPKLVEKVFGISVTRADYTKTDLTQWDFRSTPVRGMFRQLADQYQFTAQTKHLPDWVDDLDVAQKKSLLHGLWWGDGSTGGEYPRWNYSTSSAALMHQIKDLLWAVGAPAGVIEDSRLDTREKFANRSVSWSIRTTENFDGSRMQASRGAVDDQYIYHRVRSIEERYDVDKVYDFTVPGDHSYMTDSYAVHNSAAGSITSYILGIVHVCPLDNGLLFERFLERGRVGLPDIDLDFPKFQRWRVHRYVSEKYGHDHVAQIGSFQSAKSRAAIRDAARVLTPDKDLAKTQQEQDRRREIFRLGDTLAKLLETQGADPLSFAELDALDENHSQKIEFFKAVEEAGDTGRQIVALARQMENISKGVSIHPCGFVISTEPLTDIVPLRPAANEGEPDVIIWDGEMCEDMGLLKMDFLAIQNLDYMDRTFEYLAEQDIQMSVFDIPDPNDDDETVDKTYELLREGRTAGLFQLDSDGMTRVLRDVAPDNLDDLSAVVALYRPGPLSAGMPEDYAAKKNGLKEESYDHLSKDATEIEWLDTVLGETYQAALYQEQAMTLGRVVAGFDDKQRSTLRRAIGKKNRDLMREAQTWWFEGAQQEFKDDQGNVYSPVFSKDTAQRVWDFIEGAAEYSFNKSHSAAYGQVAYWTAWLKANYPVEYSAAMLAVSDNEAKRLLVIKDLISEGIPIQAPSVNTSQTGSAPVGGEVHLGLAEIRNVGKAAHAIVEEREKNGPFASLHDLASRVSTLNTLALRALIESGACDDFGTRRGLLKNMVTAKVLDLPVDDTEFGVVERDARQRAVIGTVVGSNTLDSIDLDDLADRLEEAEGDFTLDIDRLDDLLDTDYSVCHLGVVSGYDPFVSRSGLMAKAELSDGRSLPVVIFNDAHRDMVNRYGEPAIGSLMVVSGQVKANTWTDDEGDEHSVLEVLASRVWLPEDPTKVEEEPLVTAMLTDALDGKGTPTDDDGVDADDGQMVDDVDADDDSDDVPVEDGDDEDHWDGDRTPEPQRHSATPILVDHSDTVDNPDQWAGYVVVHMQRGRIDRTTGRVKGYLGSPRSVFLIEEHDQEVVVLPDYKAVIVQYSGDLDADMELLEEKLPS